MGRLVVIFLALAALWQLNSGYFDHPLLFIFGFLSIVLSIWLSARAGMLDNEGVPGGIYPGIFGYWLWLFRAIGKANIEVARHALALELKLSPKVFRVPLAAKSNVGKVTFANSITLTPGTVSVQLDEDGILVHALSEDFADIDAIRDMGEHVAATETGGAGMALSTPKRPVEGR